MNDRELQDKLGQLPDDMTPPQGSWRRIEAALGDTARRNTLRFVSARTVALAATVLLAAFAVAWFVARSHDPAGWQVARVDGREVSWSSFSAGQEIATDSVAKYVASTAIGEVLIETHTRVALRESSADRQVLSLEHGEIYARIDAPPRVFVVETPSVTAVDLGCEYRLTVDDNGSGNLTVVSGWVALEHAEREVYVPAGASARFDETRGSVAPVFADASEAFRETLGRMHDDRPVEPGAGLRQDHLELLLAEMRSFDTLTLWHLAHLASPEQRSEIFDRFRELGVVPEGYDRADFVNQNPAAADWLRLHLQETEWFRPELFFDTESPAEFLKAKKKKNRFARGG